MLRPPQYAARRCPSCTATLSNVQGVVTCSDCQWVDIDRGPPPLPRADESVNAVGRRRDGTSFVDRYNPGAWPNPRWTSSPSSTRNTAKRAILAQVREETAERVEVGASHLEVAEWAEERIRELGGQPAFPVNISVDEEAAHATPSIDDDDDLRRGDDQPRYRRSY